MAWCARSQHFNAVLTQRILHIVFHDYSWREPIRVPIFKGTLQRVSVAEAKFLLDNFKVDSPPANPNACDVACYLKCVLMPVLFCSDSPAEATALCRTGHGCNGMSNLFDNIGINFAGRQRRGASQLSTMVEQAREKYDELVCARQQHHASAEELRVKWTKVQFPAGTTRSVGLKALARGAGASTAEASTKAKAIRELILRAAPLPTSGDGLDQPRAHQHTQREVLGWYGAEAQDDTQPFESNGSTVAALLAASRSFIENETDDKFKGQRYTFRDADKYILRTPETIKQQYAVYYQDSGKEAGQKTTGIKCARTVFDDLDLVYSKSYFLLQVSELATRFSLMGRFIRLLAHQKGFYRHVLPCLKREVALCYLFAGGWQHWVRQYHRRLIFLICLLCKLCNFFTRFIINGSKFLTKAFGVGNDISTINKLLMDIRSRSQLPNNRKPTGDQNWALFCNSKKGKIEGKIQYVRVRRMPTPHP